MGKSASPPPAPDYAAAATAQGAANVDAARATARLSNPNIFSPFGSQTVTYGTPVFDQAAYDKAVAQYSAGIMPGTHGNGEPEYIYGHDGTVATVERNPKYIAPTPGEAFAPGAAPTREQFTTYQDQDSPTITQTLNPQSQQIFDAQQATRLGLANLSDDALRRAQGILNSPFQYKGPPLQTSLIPVGQTQRTLANAGAINYGPGAGDYGYASGLAGDKYGLAGAIRADDYGRASGIGAGDYGYAKDKLDLSNVAKIPVNAGMTGQQAIMARLQPQIEQSNNAYAAQLANQGIVQGSEAYNNAMQVQNQRNNDLLSQAALQGLGLDFQANNQGFGQALQQGVFGNQAIGQNFGQGLAARNQANQAIAQNFGQGLQAQNQANLAIGQNFGQGLQGQQLTNQAIGQNFGQGVASAQMNNQAQQQQYGQNLSNAQFYNQAQNQDFNQGLASAQFGNTAQQQALQQQLYERNLPLNEISALMSGSQIQNPQFQAYQGSQVVPAPLFNATQAQYNAGLQGYGMQNNSDNAFMSGLMGLGGAFLGAPGRGLAARMLNRG